MKKQGGRVLFGLLVLAVLPLAAPAGVTNYVATTGSDTTGDGTDWATACATLTGPEQAVVTRTYDSPGSQTVRLTVCNATGETAEFIREDAVRIGLHELFVARAGQTPVFPFATVETAANHLESAVVAAVSGTVIRVSEGVYAPETNIILNQAVCVRLLEQPALS